ncbi:MAG: Clp protease ClpP [Rikenellaceae bacterium]|nr:Clp protease ClpP [Rikenellaceae bacterium]
MMNEFIKIKNEADCAIIDIEGTIGVPEECQFGDHESYVATYERFKASLMRIADIEHSQIRVNIRSTGGSVNDALLIYEALRATGAKVITCCYGYTASAATIVAQAASQGCRLIAPTSLYLVHNSIAAIEGNVEELRAEVEMLQKTDERIADIYATHSGRSVEEMAALMAENGGRGRWLSPDEAIALGLVDARLDEEKEQSLAQRAKRGVQALLRAIGIGDDVEEELDAEEFRDVNYTAHHAVEVSQPQAVADSSVVVFDEAQRQAQPTVTKSVQDPDLVEPHRDSRTMAYESDARNMRRQ